MDPLKGKGNLVEYVDAVSQITCTEIVQPTMEGSLVTTNRYFDGSGSHWWQTPGSLRAALLRLDSQVGAVVNAEKHVGDPTAVSSDLARHLKRITQQMGLDVGTETTGDPDAALVFESIKPNFTRETGSSQGTGPIE